MGDAHSATDFHFLFLGPPALTNFTDDQRPLAEEKRCTAACARHVAPGTDQEEVDTMTTTILVVSDKNVGFSHIFGSFLTFRMLTFLNRFP